MVSTIRLDLLSLLGKSYIFDHVKNQLRAQQGIQFFRDYIADSIGSLAGAGILYSDRAHAVFPLMESEIDIRTEEEITNDNAKALRELCGGGEET